MRQGLGHASAFEVLRSCGLRKRGRVCIAELFTHRGPLQQGGRSHHPANPQTWAQDLA